MQYANFWSRITLPYQVIMEGWPTDVPFRPHSYLTDAQLESIHALLTLDPPGISFVKISDTALEELDRERRQLIKDGKLPAPKIHGNSAAARKARAQPAQDGSEHSGDEDEDEDFRNFEEEREDDAAGSEHGEGAMDDEEYDIGNMESEHDDEEPPLKRSKASDIVSVSACLRDIGVTYP